MKMNTGVWIDHHKAIIVTLNERDENISMIISMVEKQPGRIGGTRSTTPFESQLVQSDDRQERKFTGKLKVYYDAVIASVRGADAIMIFGPGEAKGELEKLLRDNKLGKRIVGVETADTMTDRQVAAKIRKYFLKR